MKLFNKILGICSVSGFFLRNRCLWNSKSFLHRYCNFIHGSMRLTVSAVPVERAKGWSLLCFRSCRSVEQSSVLLQKACDLFAFLNLRKFVICICVWMYMSVHFCSCAYTHILQNLTSPPHGFAANQEVCYFSSMRSLPKFYRAIQIWNVSNCKLEVLKIRFISQLLKNTWACANPQSNKFCNYQSTELHKTAECWYLYCHVTTGLMKRIGGGGSTENMHVL